MRTFLTITILSTLFLATNAAPKTDSLRRVDVDSVVVTSTRTPLSMKNSPVVTRVISSLAIEKRAAPTIENLLEKEVAGVEFHQAGYGSSLSFQGLDARYVLFMVDGERLSGETYGNIDYSRIPLSSVDRIEIVRGASSVLYGSNAMGAVVNVITAMPQKPFEAKVSLRWGSNYQNNGDETLSKTPDGDIKRYRNKLDMPNLRGDIAVGFKAGKLSSLTTVTANYTDAYKLKGRVDQKRHYDKLTLMKPKMKMENGRPVIVNGKPVMEFDPITKMPIFEKDRDIYDTTVMAAPDSRGLSISGVRNLNIRQKFDYKLSDRFRFELSGDYYDKRRYDFNSSLTDENPMSGMSSKPWTFETYKGGGGKALMEHSPNKDNKVFLSMGIDTYARSLDSLSGVTTPKQRHTLYTPRLQWSRNQRHDSRLTTGIESIVEQLKFDLNPKLYDDMKSMTTISAFGQEELFISSPLSFVAGLRVEYNNRFGWSATPKVSAKYRIGDVSLRANYSRGYRAPSLKEMYMKFKIPIPGQTTYIEGNDKLKAEWNNYVSLSGEIIKPHYYISATVYGSFFKDKIDVVGSTDDQNITHLIYDNVQKSTLAGAELMIKVKPVRNLQLSLNYNYTYRKEQMSEDQTTQYIFPSPHSGVAEAQYTKNLRKFDVGATANIRYVGGKEYSDFMPVISRSGYYSGAYTSHMGSCTTVNISAFTSFQRRYDLTVGVDNLLDYSPAVVAFNSVLVPPRNIYVRVSVKL